MFVDSGVASFHAAAIAAEVCSAGLCSLCSSACDFCGDDGKLLKRVSLKSCALMSREADRSHLQFCLLLFDGTRTFFLYAHESVAVAAASIAHRNKLFFLFFENGKRYWLAVRCRWPQGVLLGPARVEIAKVDSFLIFFFFLASLAVHNEAFIFLRASIFIPLFSAVCSLLFLAGTFGQCDPTR